MLKSIKVSHSFVLRKLPWIIAAAMFVVYLATLVTWPTLFGLPALSKAAGWDWRPAFHAPLLHLTTWPVQWLPVNWQLIGLNIMSALFAAATLGLLARSVALLPQDRTKQQRLLERSDYSLLTIPTAWAPPLLAALICGLQLTFWENAVAFTGEMLDLFLFALVIWNLLEFRLDEKPWRMPAGAFLFGAAISNNFAMIGFFPLYVAAVVWIKGMTVFNLRFVLTTLAGGILGLMFYLWLPAVVVMSDLTHHSFWEALLVNLGYQKASLGSFPRYLILITGLSSIVPVFFIGIRWPAQFGDTNPMGAKLTTMMTHLIHVIFLVACIYVAFDPPFSPRHLGGGFAFLPFYYLGALSIGYFSGYLLLICGAKPQRAWERPPAPIALLNKVLVGAILLSVIVIPASLTWRNHALLDSKLSTELASYAEAAAQTIPEGTAYILSDDSLRLYAAQAALARLKPGQQHVFIDTGSMQLAGYHRAQRQRYGTLWPGTHVQHSLVRGISQSDLLNFVVQLTTNHQAYYLHPSFGYYFERLYAIPRNNLYELRRLPENDYLAPPLQLDALKQTVAFWDAYYQDNLIPLGQRVRKAADDKTQDTFANYLAGFHSQSLDAVGVAWQRAGGDLSEAADFFRRALRLNTNSPSAFINLDFNQHLQSGSQVIPPPSPGALERLERTGKDWNSILSRFGPVDEPNALYLQSQAFIKGNNHVQAAQQLHRSLELYPAFYPARLAFAGALLELNITDEALQQVAQVRSHPQAKSFNDETKLSLIELEAWAYSKQGEVWRAEDILKQAQQDFPHKNTAFSTLANIYLSLNEYTNAVQVYEHQLKLQPNNIGALVNVSALKIRYTGDLEEAIVLLTKALSLDPKHRGALMNRAIAHLNLGRLPQAKADYLSLQSLSVKPLAPVEYGLGEIAWLEKKFNAAEQHYESFLTLVSPQTTEGQTAQKRLEAIRSGDIRKIPRDDDLLLE